MVAASIAMPTTVAIQNIGENRFITFSAYSPSGRSEFCLLSGPAAQEDVITVIAATEVIANSRRIFFIEGFAP